MAKTLPLPSQTWTRATHTHRSKHHFCRTCRTRQLFLQSAGCETVHYTATAGDEIVNETVGVRPLGRRFDFIIIMIMWISFIASLFTEIDRTVSFTVTALRSFRALRFFKGTREIMNTIGLAASTINMIFIGILVAGLMFSIVGRELFGGETAPSFSI